MADIQNPFSNLITKERYGAINYLAPDDLETAKRILKIKDNEFKKEQFIELYLRKMLDKKHNVDYDIIKRKIEELIKLIEHIIDNFNDFTVYNTESDRQHQLYALNEAIELQKIIEGRY